ncbi:MAG: hypothetical protein AAGG09_07310 [Pseudomonadota bacterium]
MFRLFSIVYSIASMVLAGGFVVAALVLGFVSGAAIIAAVLCGAVLAGPVAYIVARKLYDM